MDLPAHAYLVVNSQVFPLDQKVISVGRGLENDLVINDPSVSRVHARLEAVKGKFIVSDQKSTNGISVNGKTVHKRALKSGDSLAFADVITLYVEYSTGLLKKSMDHTQYPLKGDE